MEPTTRRLHHFSKVFEPESSQQIALNLTAAQVKSPDDVVIVAARRTAMTRARKGAFKDTHPTDMLIAAFEAVLEDSGVDPAVIGDVTIGNVLLPGAGATQVRMAQLVAGIPESVPIHTVNRQCSSGLQAFASGAAAIKAGFVDVHLSGGMEHMSSGDMMNVGSVNERVFTNDSARDTLFSMGETSENVAEKYGVSREEQDAFAADSHRKALLAQEQGLFDKEIVPVNTKVTDAEGKEHEVTVAKDECPRPGTTAEKLAKLKPVFKADGSTTAGNASPTNDGAAAVISCTRAYAEQNNLPILGVFRSYAVVGVPPAVMGIGPAYAIPEALKKAGMSLDDVDVFEINEAFASQASWCVNELKINPAKVNPYGGAIALGHPLGCTGSRQIATLLHGMQRSGSNVGVISMCIGTGMGAAAVFTRE